MLSSLSQTKINCFFTNFLVSLMILYQRRIQDFPGGTNPKSGVSTYYLAKFSRKLHENEENWTEKEEGARPKFYNVDPPLFIVS